MGLSATDPRAECSVDFKVNRLRSDDGLIGRRFSTPVRAAVGEASFDQAAAKSAFLVDSGKAIERKNVFG